MQINEKAPAAARRARAQEMSAWSADILDNTAALRAVQAARLLQRIKVSQAVALTLADLAFQNGRQA